MPQRPSSARARKRPRSTRLTRTEWLSRALDLLAREGTAKLPIETLCRKLSVSRGSFYWHFESRDDFIRALIEYWHLVFTQSVVMQVRAIEGSAQDRLLHLMEIVHEGRHARYDLAVRAWASREPELVAHVAAVDEERLGYVRSLFAEMGFRGRALEMRTRLLIGYLTAEPMLESRLPEEEQRALLAMGHTLLTRR